MQINLLHSNISLVSTKPSIDVILKNLKGLKNAHFISQSKRETYFFNIITAAANSLNNNKLNDELTNLETHFSKPNCYGKPSHPKNLEALSKVKAKIKTQSLPASLIPDQSPVTSPVLSAGFIPEIVPQASSNTEAPEAAPVLPAKVPDKNIEPLASSSTEAPEAAPVLPAKVPDKNIEPLASSSTEAPEAAPVLPAKVPTKDEILENLDNLLDKINRTSQEINEMALKLRDLDFIQLKNLQEKIKLFQIAKDRITFMLSQKYTSFLETNKRESYNTALNKEIPFLTVTFMGDNQERLAKTIEIFIDVNNMLGTSKEKILLNLHDYDKNVDFYEHYIFGKVNILPNKRLVESFMELKNKIAEVQIEQQQKEAAAKKEMPSPVTSALPQPSSSNARFSVRMNQLRGKFRE
ncbi:MAG: hypothetical protein WC860_09630 [Candidatus Margulisiibacteriota bacterium]|jgi:hypothetical protein